MKILNDFEMKMFTVENKYFFTILAIFILIGMLLIAACRYSFLSGMELSGIFLLLMLILAPVGRLFCRRLIPLHPVPLTDAKPDAHPTNGQLETVTRQMKHQIYVLHNLFEISIDLSSILDLERLINSYLLALIGQLRTTRAMLLLVEPSEFSTLPLVIVKGFTPGDCQPLALSNGTEIHRFFQKDPRPLEITNPRLRTVLGPKCDLLNEKGFRWIAPLIHNGTLHGLVAVGPKLNQCEYAIADIEMFSMMTNFAAVAFSNAQQYQAIEKISVTDGLTGLFNYRYFRSQLKRELDRARRCEHSLSLMIIDVDFFKNYNDTLGHLAGDLALQNISKIIQKTARKTDIVARYGGEEFCVILPEVEIRGAKIFGERLRANVEAFPMPSAEVQPLGKMTVSLGAASFPLDAQFDNQLITFADQALYLAKSNGRNQLRLFAESTN